MILTITPNAAIDKTYTVESFGLDRVHRPSDSKTVPGGKGINVVRVLNELEHKGLITGFIGGKNGDSIIEGLDEEGLAHDFIRVNDESRLCIAVMDPVNGTQTEINENGPVISTGDLERMYAKIRDLVRGMEYVVMCGSVPPGVPDDFYARVIEIAREAGVRAVLDSSGDQLTAAVQASPYIVKPNVNELSQLVGTELFTHEEILGAANSLKRYGIELIAVTMGRSGALVTDGVQAWKAVPPEIQFASAVGSGDSFLAAFLDSLSKETSLSEALVWGTAAGAANATSYGAGFCSKECIIEMKQGVTLTKIN